MNALDRERYEDELEGRKEVLVGMLRAGLDAIFEDDGFIDEFTEYILFKREDARVAVDDGETTRLEAIEADEKRKILALLGRGLRGDFA
jgi:hypothetical protein